MTAETTLAPAPRARFRWSLLVPVGAVAAAALIGILPRRAQRRFDRRRGDGLRSGRVRLALFDRGLDQPQRGVRSRRHRLRARQPRQPDQCRRRRTDRGRRHRRDRRCALWRRRAPAARAADPGADAGRGHGGRLLGRDRGRPQGQGGHQRGHQHAAPVVHRHLDGLLVGAVGGAAAPAHDHLGDAAGIPGNPGIDAAAAAHRRLFVPAAYRPADRHRDRDHRRDRARQDDVRRQAARGRAQSHAPPAAPASPTAAP